MQTVTIPVSDEILAAANMDTEEMAVAMSREYAIKMFQRGKLTLMQSAGLCNMNIYDFLSVLSQARIPVITYDIEAVKKELSYFKLLMIIVCDASPLIALSLCDKTRMTDSRSKRHKNYRNPWHFAFGKRKGLVVAIKPFLDQLWVFPIRISDSLYQDILKLANE
jgi:predicted HTH domain antitoxin